jgi:type I restriction enzyme M protein
MIDRVHLELTGEDIQRLGQTYHAWRGGDNPIQNPHSAIQGYQDVAGFCRSATVDDIRAYGHALTPGRYVGSQDVEDDCEPFEDKVTRLLAELTDQFAESVKLEHTIKVNLEGLGYAG